MIYSLRSRVITGIVAGIIFVLCVLCAVVYTATRQSLIYNFDKSMLSVARTLSAIIEDETYDYDKYGEEDLQGKIFPKGRKIDFEFDVSAIAEFKNLSGGAYYQFRDTNGTTIIRSPSLEGTDLDIFKTVSDIPQYTECILPDGRVGRAVGFQFIPKAEGGTSSALSITFAREAESITNHLNFLARLLLISSGAMIVLSVMVAFLVTRAGLRPIHGLADEISAINTEDFREISISENYPEELLPINRCLNELLHRIKLSFDRERRFNSDIAHELRTPIAGIQSTIEVCLSKPRLSEEYKAGLEVSLEITKSMHQMIDALLSLAKLESGQVTLNREQISLKNIVADSWQSFANRASEREITFENKIPESANLFSDKGYVTLALMNIFENAVEYSNDKGRIWVESGSSEDGTTISISNTGCALKEEDLEHIFDSFWRQEQARSETGKHCGIGLSIVQKVIKELGGTVGADIQKGRIFSIRIVLRTIAQCG